jgi:bacillithiol biosynthesis deacetylase BshB1
MKLDILAFGAHPDDVELSCSGTLLIEKQRGKKVGIIDLTEGELGTRGNIETRRQEAADASGIMGIDVRENLGLPDGFFRNDKETLLKVIEVIRKYQPDILICNAIEDRHPDHGKAAGLIQDAAFLSGLLKIETKEHNVPWRPKHVFYYIQDSYIEPHFLVDITPVFEKKMAAIKAYKTQFHNTEIEGPETYISRPGFLEFIANRSKIFGKRIGVEFAEGFITKNNLGINSLDALI